jgi:hypothetical protein
MPLAGQFVRASDLPNRVGCRLRRVANQSVASGGFANISWDTEDQDTDGFIAVTSATVTIPTGLGGLYAITFQADGQGTLTGSGFLSILVTSAGITYPTDFLNILDVAVADRGTIGITVPLNAGDSFTCAVRHATGTNQNFLAWLACYRTGA